MTKSGSTQHPCDPRQFKMGETGPPGPCLFVPAVGSRVLDVLVLEERTSSREAVGGADDPGEHVETIGVPARNRSQSPSTGSCLGGLFFSTTQGCIRRRNLGHRSTKGAGNRAGASAERKGWTTRDGDYQIQWAARTPEDPGCRPFDPTPLSPPSRRQLLISGGDEVEGSLSGLRGSGGVIREFTTLVRTTDRSLRSSTEP